MPGIRVFEQNNLMILLTFSELEFAQASFA